MDINDIPCEIYHDSIIELLQEGKVVEVRARGGSMLPYLCGNGNEILIVSPCSPSDLQRGELVIFGRKKLICHRIIKRDGNNLTIQGDGIIRKKEQVEVTDVKGIVRKIIKPNGKTVSTQTPAVQRYWRIWLRLPATVKWFIIFPYRVKAKLYRILKQ